MNPADNMTINRKELAEIATLAQLNVPEKQLDEITTSLNQVMVMIEQINEINTTDTKPMSHPNDATQVTRMDQVTDESHKEQLLALAAQADADHYLVPKVIG